MRRFLLKMGSVFAFIAAVLALQGLLLGTMPVLLALLLLPSFGIISAGLFSAGVGRRRRTATRHRPVAARAAVAARPNLRVVTGNNRPNGPKAA